MVLLADVGGISGVRTTLSSVKVPPDVINDIVAILAETSPDNLAPTQAATGEGRLVRLRRGALSTSARTPPSPPSSSRTP